MIGVSFTGHDGRKVSFGVQGAEDAASRMAGLAGSSLRESMNDVQGLVRAAKRPQRQQTPEPLGQKKERVLPGGSVVRSNDGALCLRGEESNPLVVGTKVYGAKDGGKGFFSFDEMDPPVNGAVVGKEVGDGSQSLDPDDARKDLPDGAAWSMRVQTDERADKDAATGLITVFKYFRLLHFSAVGRVIGCSGEWREVAFSFLPGEGGGRWCVRPVLDQSGHILELLFGSGEVLGGDDANIDEIRELDSVTSVRTGYCPRGQ